MKNLIIVSARGFGREVYNWALGCNAYNNEWTIKGFLDDNPQALYGFPGYDLPILSSVEEYSVQENDVFICALGNGKERRKYAEIIESKGGTFTNLVRPNVSINRLNVKLGKGVIISDFSVLSNDTTIGDFTIIQSFVAIGHDTTIGNYCQINAYTHIGGGCQIGENVSINPGSVILPKLKVGDNASVGAGSVVLKGVESNTSVFGNPAKRIL